MHTSGGQTLDSHAVGLIRKRLEMTSWFRLSRIWRGGTEANALDQWRLGDLCFCLVIWVIHYGLWRQRDRANIQHQKPRDNESTFKAGNSKLSLAQNNLHKHRLQKRGKDRGAWEVGALHLGNEKSLGHFQSGWKPDGTMYFDPTLT